MEATGSNPVQSIDKITETAIGEYLTLLELRGVTKRHKKEVKRYLLNYKKYILSTIDKTKSMEYFKKMFKENSLAYYKRQMYQILRFLKFLKIEWVKEIKLPADPHYKIKRITITDLEQTLDYFKDNIQMQALVSLGAYSGLRAMELYQLTSNDFELENRIIYVRHEPIKGKTTKTKKSRVTFFTPRVQSYLKKYFKEMPIRLFAQKTCNRAFKNAPIHVKDLRKYFSQEWDRHGGPTSIKKILMGHSLKGDVDLMHYNYQSEDDLKQIYDKVMGK